MNKIYLTWGNVFDRAFALRNLIKQTFPTARFIYGVPRGGNYAALAVWGTGEYFSIVMDPNDADIFIDDIVDSGSTRQKWQKKYPRKPLLALYDKSIPESVPDGWLVFPWETDHNEDNSIIATITNRLRENNVAFKANDNIAHGLLAGEMQLVEAEVEKRAKALLEALLIDVPNDHNTQDTPKRLAKMYCREILKGRFTTMPTITSFPNVMKVDEMYTTGPITIRSVCAHHMCPIVGKAWIGVLPGERLIGLSKFNRVVDWLASRGQIQEELTAQIADAIEKIIEPQGIAVVVKASHSCMTWRGVQEDQEAEMTTSVMRGVFRTKPEARAEFFALIS